MATIRARLSFANVIAVVALFVALGGGAYAVGLAKNSVKSKQIKDGQVKSVDVADDALTGTDVLESSLELPAAAPGPAGPPGATGAPGPQGSPDTAAQVLGKMRSVDGADSGLDADQLDGHEASEFTRGGALGTGTSIGVTAGFTGSYTPFVGLVELKPDCNGVGTPGISLVNISADDTLVLADTGTPSPEVSSPLMPGAATPMIDGATTNGSGDHVTYLVRRSGNSSALATIEVWVENPASTFCFFHVLSQGSGNLELP